MAGTLKRLLDLIFSDPEKIVKYQTMLCSLKAIGPENSGQGEMEKARYIESLLKGMDFELQRHDAEDKRVPSGLRPNIIARRRGRKPECLWLFAHMDVVPAGDTRLWHSDPWTLRREGDSLFGRGVEDNPKEYLFQAHLCKWYAHGWGVLRWKGRSRLDVH